MVDLGASTYMVAVLCAPRRLARPKAPKPEISSILSALWPVRANECYAIEESFRFDNGLRILTIPS